MNSPARCRRLASIVSTFDGGCAAQCTPAEDDRGEHEAHDGGHDVRPPSLGIVDDVMARSRAQPTWPLGRKTKTKNASQMREQDRDAQSSERERRRADPWRRSPALRRRRHGTPRSPGGRRPRRAPRCDRRCRHGAHSGYPGSRLNAASTVGGLNGTDRNRAPVASNTALAIAEGHDGRRRLARTPGNFVRPVDQIDDDLGHVGKRQDRIASPVEAGDRAAAERQLLDHAAAHGLHDVAFDLVAQAVGIDDLAAVVHDEHAIDLDPARRAIDRHVGDDRPHRCARARTSRTSRRVRARWRRCRADACRAAPIWRSAAGARAARARARRSDGAAGSRTDRRPWPPRSRRGSSRCRRCSACAPARESTPRAAAYRRASARSACCSAVRRECRGPGCESRALGRAVLRQLREHRREQRHAGALASAAPAGRCRTSHAAIRPWSSMLAR